MTRKLIKALREQKQQNKQVDLQIYGSLGVPLNGSKLVEVPNRNSYVYVRLRDNQNEVIQAFNNKVATSYGLPVIVHREGPRYVVDGVNTLRYNNNLNNFAAYLPKHGQVHSFFPGGGGDVVWTYSRQMMPLLVYPNSANTGTGVTLYSQPLLINNQWQLVGGTGTQDFSIYIPTGSNSVMGLIYLDANTGNPGVLINSGTPMSSSITGTGDVMPYIPVPNLATQIPLAAVKINTGTTTVGWDNLYDMREWVHAIPSGTSSGGGGGSTGISGTFIQDEGIPQGFVTTLNFVGVNIDASVSGSVARVFVTGSTGGGTVNPPITGSFVVQNNGLTLGSATILNFTNGVSASISGSVAQIVATGTATYVRTAPPISLSSVTGAYWQTQEQIFVSGSLALFNQGHALIPSIDYLEQYPSSGTFQYISAPPTGTYNLAIYGVPVAGGNAGGGGGGSASVSVSPITTNLLTRIPETVVGTWTRSVPVDMPYRYFYSNSSNADGDGFTLNFYLPVGTWKVSWNAVKNTDRPIVDVKLDGTVVGSVNLNAALNVVNIAEVTGLVISSAGLHTIGFYANGSTGGGHTHSYSEVELIRTA